MIIKPSDYVDDAQKLGDFVRKMFDKEAKKQINWMPMKVPRGLESVLFQTTPKFSKLCF